jgi:hypothetical protein
MPSGFAPKSSHLEKAKREGLDVNEQFQNFLVNVEKRSARYSSWDAAFTEWLGRQKNFGPQRQAPARSASVEDIA